MYAKPTLLILSLIATAASQDACVKDPTTSSCTTYTYPSSSALSSLQTLCQSSKNLPACSWYSSTCSSSSSSSYCDPFTLLNTACKDDSLPASTPSCTDVQSLCKNSTVVAQCKSTLAIPTAKNASALEYSICSQMPDMTSCQGKAACPPPDATTGVSNCDVFGELSKSCIEMPTMNQCATFTSFCTSVNKAGSLCGGNSTSTSPSPSPSPAAGKSGAASLAPATGLVAALTMFAVFTRNM
ncbi:hypothetical protein HDV00_006193 [Rhizophlyctis rosea]|nr:hypothetical protein HDV00_006193 [Rhizophlyctis rosea]